MYNLYDMLKDGKSADEIADAFTNELNAAIQKKKEEDEAAEAAEMDARYKKTVANDIAETLNSFIVEFYPILVDDDEVIDGEMVISFFDALAGLQEGLNGLKVSLFDTPTSKKVSIKAHDNISDIFDKFFDKYGL